MMYNFYKYQKFMSAGIYAYDNSIKFIARSDHYTAHKANQIFQQNYNQVFIRLFILLLRKILFNHKIRISNFHHHLDNFSGSVYRPVRSITGYSDSRIFDFDHQKVLNLFATRSDFYSTLKNYEYFQEFFPLPKILSKDEENLSVIEELIQFQQYSEWDEHDKCYIIDEIFKKYIHYFHACKKRENVLYNKLSSFLPSDRESYEIQWFIDEIHPMLLNMKYPCLKLHGDLWTANIMLIKKDSNQIYVIDWEYSNEYLFFYDFFNLMWLEVYVNHNEFYLNKYVRGEMDIYFEKIFAIFDLTFQKEHRLGYLYIFFLNFYKERVQPLHKSERHQFIHRFKKTIATIKKEGTEPIYKMMSQ
ncbi:phosphotransferase [Heyndrickxia camelliae]|nr:phosphotransferase [Heyndrickxia camelliae]